MADNRTSTHYSTSEADRREFWTCYLLAVEVYPEEVDGSERWMVSPVYLKCERIISIPDDRGWDELEEALEHAQEMRDKAKADGTYLPEIEKD